MAVLLLQNEDWDRIFGEPAKTLSSKELSGVSSKSKKPQSSPETRKKGEGVSEPLSSPPKSPSASQGDQFGFGEKSLLRVQGGADNGKVGGSLVTKYLLK